jgi:hypothetical protein
MATMCCPSCGESVDLGESGVTFKHTFHASGRSSMFHDETLVHECDVKAPQAQHEAAPAFSPGTWASVF